MLTTNSCTNNMTDLTIKENQFVLMQRIGSESLRLLRMERCQKVAVDRLKFYADDAIGSEFGIFEVVSGKLKQHVSPIKTLSSITQNCVFLDAEPGTKVAQTSHLYVIKVADHGLDIYFNLSYHLS